MLEMVMFNYPKIQGLEAFRNLKELRILQQAISEMEGLSELPLLESLWICETNIPAIRGLDNCFRLKRLYLYPFHPHDVVLIDTQVFKQDQANRKHFPPGKP